MKNVEELKPDDSCPTENFDTELAKLSKKHAEAKDNVKFLSTLERQFKNIDTGSPVEIEETLTSLMNGLKLVWIISRHINDDRMGKILRSIGNEIANKVATDIKITEIFNKKADDAIDLLDKAINCMERWEQTYHITRKEINDEGLDKRWEHTHKELFGRTGYMTGICKELKEVIKVRKEFNILLGPELKAVIGDTEGIALLTEEVYNLKTQFENITSDIFEETSRNQWDITFESFKGKVTDIETQAIGLITKTFKSELKSSERAFDLLQNFKNIMVNL
jgi:dynein heavy chain, axonemal